MIRTEKLCCGYGSRMVLQNVSLSMEAGELWCVLGANGVGKSTLFKTLLGLLKPMGGTVLVDVTWTEKHPIHLCKESLLPSRPGVFPLSG